MLHHHVLVSWTLTKHLWEVPSGGLSVVASTSRQVSDWSRMLPGTGKIMIFKFSGMVSGNFRFLERSLKTAPNYCSYLYRHRKEISRRSAIKFPITAKLSACPQWASASIFRSQKSYCSKQIWCLYIYTTQWYGKSLHSVRNGSAVFPKFTVTSGRLTWVMLLLWRLHPNSHNVG